MFVKCEHVGCNMCEHGRIVGYTHSGHRLYSCETKERKHRWISCFKCKKFACRNNGWPYCNDCNGNKR